MVVAVLVGVLAAMAGTVPGAVRRLPVAATVIGLVVPAVGYGVPDTVTGTIVPVAPLEFPGSVQVVPDNLMQASGGRKSRRNA